MQDRDPTWPPVAADVTMNSNADDETITPSLYNNAILVDSGDPLPQQLHHDAPAAPLGALQTPINALSRPPLTASMRVPTRKRSRRISEGVAPSWSSPLLSGGSRFSLSLPSGEAVVAKRARRLSASLLHMSHHFGLGLLGQGSDSESHGASRGGRAQSKSSRGRQLKTREELSDEEFEQSLQDYGSEEEVPSHLARYGQSIEKFLAWRWAKPEPTQDFGRHKETSCHKEYHVKWKGMSYLHCTWVKRRDLDAAAHYYPSIKQRVRMFDLKMYPEAKADGDSDVDGDAAEAESTQSQHHTLGVDPAWVTVSRIIDRRKTRESGMEFLVKWEGLGYDEATWESPGLLRSPEALAAIQSFESLLSIAVSAEKRSRAFQDSQLKHGATEVEGNVRQYSDTPLFLQGGKLHPYQLEGLNWLLFAWRQHKHVILADEMGLGKTIQAVSYAASLREDFFVRHPQLVIVPLSTLPNWEREFKTWAPQLNVVSFVGNAASRAVIKKHEFYTPAEAGADQTARPMSRASLAGRVRFDVLLTTYEMMLSEESALSSFEWENMIVDEGHRLKNKSSRLFQVLHDFKTRQRTLLTGTPLQNNLDELFMLMHFLEPEKFPSLESFQAQFSEINAEEQIERLHTLLKPHLLRRLKKDVLKQMPPKKEQVVRVELSNLQKEYYKSVLTKSYPVLVGNSKAAGGQIPAKLKNVVMELRKCCNHPYLFEGTERSAKNKEEMHRQLTAASGKLALLGRMLPKLRAAGHRVLIYSQFARMLDILEDWLAAAGWGEYCRIDGSVSSTLRQMRIDKFNMEHEKYFCFLLSTRAGGLGINLATADTVIIYDSDWNPHNDLQAQARAHRLGQQKAVMIYRLVTRASIEERMMQQSKKKMVLEHVVVHKMSNKGKDGGEPKQSELNDMIRYGAKELFADNEQAATPSAKSVKEEGHQDSPATAAAGTSSPCTEAEAAKSKSTIAQEEEAGRTGGQVGKGIVYSDEDIDRLLDRSELLRQQEEQAAGKHGDTEAEEEEYLKAFKVADFGVIAETAEDAERPEEEGKPGDDLGSEANAAYWDQLIKDRFGDLQQQESQAMGKGRRSRREINYNETFKSARNNTGLEQSDPGAHGDEEAFLEDSPIVPTRRSRRAAAATASASDRDASSRRRGQRELIAHPEEPPLVEGKGDGLKIAGFLHRERCRFLNLLLRFGLGEKLKGREFNWDRYMHRFPGFEPSAVSRYGQLLVQQLACSSASGLALLPCYAREAMLHGHQPREILERLALLRLVAIKVKASEQHPDAEFQVGSEDRKLMMQPGKHWQNTHDKCLLQGILMHGYGRWRDILQDESLRLMQPVIGELAHLAAAAVQQGGASAHTSMSGGFCVSSEGVPRQGDDTPMQLGSLVDSSMEIDPEDEQQCAGDGAAAGVAQTLPTIRSAASTAAPYGCDAESKGKAAAAKGTHDGKEVSPEEWLQRRAQQLGEALRYEMCAKAVEKPEPKPDPRFQVPRGYGYAATRMPPPPPGMMEAARRAAGAPGSSRVHHGDGRGGVLFGGLRGLPLTNLDGDSKHMETVHAVVASYNLLCNLASDVRSDASQALSAAASGRESEMEDAGGRFRRQLQSMESHCGMILEALRKDHEHKRYAAPSRARRPSQKHELERQQKAASAKKAQAQREREALQRMVTAKKTQGGDQEQQQQQQQQDRGAAALLYDPFSFAAQDHAWTAPFLPEPQLLQEQAVHEQHIDAGKGLVLSDSD